MNQWDAYRRRERTREAAKDWMVTMGWASHQQDAFMRMIEAVIDDR